jgi:hypothetical protein
MSTPSLAARLALALVFVSRVAAAQSCITSLAQARFDGGAYDHWVSVTNECPLLVYCSVWTDVNPSPQVVPIEPGQAVDVLTFRASPARVFTPQVVCGYANEAAPWH